MSTYDDGKSVEENAINIKVEKKNIISPCEAYEQGKCGMYHSTALRRQLVMKCRWLTGIDRVKDDTEKRDTVEDDSSRRYDDDNRGVSNRKENAV